MRLVTAETIIVGMSERGLHTIEDDLADSWFEDWIGAGVNELEVYLGKHAAFEEYLEAHSPA